MTDTPEAKERRRQAALALEPARRALRIAAYKLLSDLAHDDPQNVRDRFIKETEVLPVAEKDGG